MPHQGAATSPGAAPLSQLGAGAATGTVVLFTGSFDPAWGRPQPPPKLPRMTCTSEMILERGEFGGELVSLQWQFKRSAMRVHVDDFIVGVLRPGAAQEESLMRCTTTSVQWRMPLGMVAAGGRYRFTVRAVNRFGSGVSSEPLLFTPRFSQRAAQKAPEPTMTAAARAAALLRTEVLSAHAAHDRQRLEGALCAAAACDDPEVQRWAHKMREVYEAEAQWQAEWPKRAEEKRKRIAEHEAEELRKRAVEQEAVAERARAALAERDAQRERRDREEWERKACSAAISIGA